MARRDRPTIYVNGGYASGFVAQAIKAEAERTGARVVGKLDLPDTPAPRSREREQQEVALRAASPLQSKGRAVEDAAHLPLFVAANEPKLF